MKLNQVVKKLEELQLHCKEMAADRERDGEFDTVWHEDVEALDNAIEIIGKEIPKKIYHKQWNGINGVPYDLCPNCKTNLCTTGLFPNEKEKYCGVCGQKLDWEVSE